MSLRLSDADTAITGAFLEYRVPTFTRQAMMLRRNPTAIRRRVKLPGADLGGWREAPRTTPVDSWIAEA